jgi:putative transposase
MFNKDYYYHIYNRGVDKRIIFDNDIFFQRFINSLLLFNNNEPIGSIQMLSAESKIEIINNKNKLVSIVAYCLNPNHFHLILKQLVDNGISEFMKRVGGGYTNYYNLKNKRSGALFQGRYKFKELSNTFDLMKVAIYINTNPEIHGISLADIWEWSSYDCYKNNEPDLICNPTDVLKLFDSHKDYLKESRQMMRESKKYKKILKEIIIE